MSARVRVPPIVSVQVAVQVYWGYPELGNEQLKILFGQRSPNTYSLLKKAAWEQMRADDMIVANPRRVNTDAAYRAWGLNIDDLTQRYAKLQKIGVIPKEVRTACG